MMRTVHHLIALFASLLSLLLLLLIVIYDGVGTYDEMIIMDWVLRLRILVLVTDMYIYIYIYIVLYWYNSFVMLAC